MSFQWGISWGNLTHDKGSFLCFSHEQMRINQSKQHTDKEVLRLRDGDPCSEGKWKRQTHSSHRYTAAAHCKWWGYLCVLLTHVLLLRGKPDWAQINGRFPAPSATPEAVFSGKPKALQKEHQLCRPKGGRGTKRRRMISTQSSDKWKHAEDVFKGSAEVWTFSRVRLLLTAPHVREVILKWLKYS